MKLLSMSQMVSSVSGHFIRWITETNTGGQELVETGLLTPDQLAGYAVTAVWTIINLLVAYLILRHFVFRPIIRLLEKRREEVENELSDANEKQKQAHQLLSDAQDRVEDAKSEAASVISEARVQADRQGLTIVNAAHKEANTIVERASEDAKRMHNAMLDQMRDEVADLAVSIASKVVGSIIDEAHEQELSRRIMEETLKAEVKKFD